MDIREAALIHEAGKEMVVKNLLELHARIESLSRQVITLERKITVRCPPSFRLTGGSR